MKYNMPTATSMRQLADDSQPDYAKELLNIWEEAIREASAEGLYHVFVPHNWRLRYTDVERIVFDVMDEAGYKVWVTTRKGEQGFGIHWHEDVNYDVRIDW